MGSALHVASLGAPEGVRYRLGVHRGAGSPMKCMGNEDARKVPLGAHPGMRIQAGASMEKSVDLWKAELSRSLKRSYSFLEARPRISLSGALGGLLGARLDPLFGNNESQPLIDLDHRVDRSPPQAFGNHYSAGLFASSAISSKIKARTKFKDHFKWKKDHFKWKESTSQGESVDSGNDHGHPTLAMSFQQQVIGPLCARIDSRVSVDPRNLKLQPSVQEIIYGLVYPQNDEHF